jgi:hypothetical protein
LLAVQVLVAEAAVVEAELLVATAEMAFQAVAVVHTMAVLPIWLLATVAMELLEAVVVEQQVELELQTLKVVMAVLA